MTYDFFFFFERFQESYLQGLLEFFGHFSVQFQSGGPLLVLHQLPSNVLLFRRGVIGQRCEIAEALQE